MAEPKINKENTPTRLYAKDAHHIKRKVKDLGYADKRFMNNSAAIRYYVRVGIAAEERTKASNSLDDQIIKASQKEVVGDSLVPLKKSIDGLINAMERFEVNQTGHFTSQSRETEALARRIEGGFAAISKYLAENFGAISERLKTIVKTNSDTLRGIVMLRSMIYVMLLGYSNGVIKSIDINRWRELITKIHSKAVTLTSAEIEYLAKISDDKETLQELSVGMLDDFPDIDFHPKSVKKEKTDSE